MCDPQQPHYNDYIFGLVMKCNKRLALSFHGTKKHRSGGGLTCCCDMRQERVGQQVSGPFPKVYYSKAAEGLKELSKGLMHTCQYVIQCELNLNTGIFFP